MTETPGQDLERASETDVRVDGAGVATDEPVRVDRDKAVVVTGRTASQLADGLGRATKTGFGIVRRARPREVFELVPPEDLVKGLKKRALRYATPSSGDASVLIKNVSDGQMAGRADLRKVSSSAAKALGPMAWEVLAYATQQHFMVEISASLEGIEKGVDELKERLDDDRVGTIKTVEAVAERFAQAAHDDGGVSEHLLDELRERTTDVEETFNQAAATVERQVAKYRHGGIEAGDVERSFAVLVYAFQSLQKASAILVSIPYGKQSATARALRDEQRRIDGAVERFRYLAGELVAASEHWAQQAELYEQRRSEGLLPRQIPLLPPIERAREGLLPVKRIHKPQGASLSDAAMGPLREVSSPQDVEPPVMYAEVIDDGTVLIGPPATPDAR